MSSQAGHDDGAPLELGHDEDGAPRHLLAGRPLESGSQLEVLLEDGSWLRGRYEARPAEEDVQAWLYLPLRIAEGEEPSGRSLEAPIPRGARFRWPAQ